MLVMISPTDTGRDMILSCDRNDAETDAFVERIVDVLSAPPGSAGSLQGKKVFIPHSMEMVPLMAVVLAVTANGGSVAVFDPREGRYVSSEDIRQLIPY